MDELALRLETERVSLRGAGAGNEDECASEEAPWAGVLGRGCDLFLSTDHEAFVLAPAPTVSNISSKQTNCTYLAVMRRDTGCVKRKRLDECLTAHSVSVSDRLISYNHELL